MTLRSACISVGAVLAFLCCGAMPVSASTSINQLGSDIDGEAAGDNSGRSVSLSSDGTILAIGATQNDGNGSDAGHVRVYEWNGGAWIQKGADIDGEAEGDQLGRSVSLSSDGTILAIGANLNDGNGSDAGHVRVYEWNGSAWVQKGGDIDGEAAGDYSGYSVSLSSDGTILAIGATRNDGNGSDAGHVRVYEWNGSAWVQKGSDIDGEAERDYSGRLVSLSSDGNVVAIGAYLNDGAANNAGHVRVYEWNGTAWVQMGADIDGEAEGDNSGYSVSLSSDGTILAIAARYNDGNGTDSGHVRVYEWNGSAWQQKGADIDGEAASDYSGVSLSLSSDGTILAIGATRNDGNGSDAGHVRVYEWNGSAWVQKGVDIDGEAEGDFSGAFLSLSSDGTILAISGLLNDGNGSAAGHVRVYSISPDADGDGVGDGTDNCPASSNADQTDTDSDGTGDACDTDDDGDGVLDGADNCPLISNADQADTDSDGTGDECSDDNDGDGMLDGADNCPLISNVAQTDTDSDGTGDACDIDDDGDGILDGADNCPLISNADQSDTDSNGAGNACDTDDDGDGVLDVDEVREDCRIKVDCDSDGETDLTDPFPLAITEVSLGTGESIKTVPPDRLSTCSLNQGAAYVSPYTAPEGMEGIDTQVHFSLFGCDTDSPETISVEVDFGKALPAEGLVCKVEGTSEPVDMTEATINGTAVTYTLTDNGQFDANPTAGVIDDPVTVIVPAPVPVPIRSLWLLLVGLLIPAMAWRKHHPKWVNQWR